MKIMKNKGQAAMEFLMTYGWAILVVLLAIGALAYFGVLSPQNLLPERTTFTAPIPNLDNAVVSASTNSVEIAFKNNKGVAITLPLTGTLETETGTTCVLEAVDPITGTYDGNPIVADTTSIPNGGTFLLTWNCVDLATAPETGSSFKANLMFQYTNEGTGQTISHTGTVEGKYS